MPEPQDLETKFCPLIEAELVDLRKQSAATAADRRPVELDQQSVGRLSRMYALQMQAMAKAVEQRRKARIVSLEQATRRMADDEYGFCANCGGGLIGERRLAIDPASPKCVNCAVLVISGSSINAKFIGSMASSLVGFALPTFGKTSRRCTQQL